MNDRTQYQLGASKALATSAAGINRAPNQLVPIRAPERIVPASDDCVAAVVSMIVGRTRGAASVAGDADARQFARASGLAPAGRRPAAEIGARWLATAVEDRAHSVFELWLSNRRANRRSRFTGPARHRLRQRLCALLRGHEAGVWYGSVALARNRIVGSSYRTSRRKACDHARQSRDAISLSLVELSHLGMLDLGYDGKGSLVAFRLTPRGAILLACPKRWQEERVLGTAQPDKGAQ